MTAPIAGYYTIYPRGAGAANGPMPSGYVIVSRWVSAAEAKLWMMNGGTFVPVQVGAGDAFTLRSLGSADLPGLNQFASISESPKPRYKLPDDPIGDSCSKLSETCRFTT
jgi:hypothetical protein